MKGPRSLASTINLLRKWRREGAPTRPGSPYGYLVDDKEAFHDGLGDALHYLKVLQTESEGKLPS